MRCGLLVLSVLVCGVAPALAVDQGRKIAVPVRLRLIAKQTTYKLPKGDTLTEQLAAAKKSGKYPEPPAVDFVLELTNISDQEVQIWVKGDPVLLDLRLKGEGATEGLPRVLMPREVQLGEPVSLAAGKSYEIALTSLRCGLRGKTKHLYWTKPGDHTLTATLRTGLKIGPATRGGGRGQAQYQDDGFEGITLVSNEVKLKVEEK